MIYGALMILALGLLTSTTLLALSHILIAVPGGYFLFKIDWGKVSKSSWSLLALSFVIVISVLVNQDIAVNGVKPAFKVKYFLFGYLMIAPFSWYFKNYFDEKKISYLIYAFCFATTIATVAGLVGLCEGYNYILMKKVPTDRNGGLFGMLMNYAHNLIYFEIIILGMIFCKKEVEKFVNMNFLYAVFIINLLGLYMTYTRGAWLGFLAAIPFFYFKKNLKVFVVIIISLAVFGAGVFIFAGNSVIRPHSDKMRMSQWKAAGKAFQERPIWGYGYLNFETHSREIKKRFDIGELQFGGHAHNNFLEILASTGLVGFVTFMSWLIFWFLEMYKRDDVIGKIGLPFIIVFSAGGLTQSTVSLGINLFFIMAVFGITQIRKELVI